MSKVQLYVYDLSRGMAKSMSLMLTGKQIDGIWHTSVVAYGRETFYGQGILQARPGTTHHGQPVQAIDCGETHIDEGTFDEYIAELAETYTAQKYHLMDFNCNHFSADVVGFLTGATIPKWISGLPAEFLATPLGQQMRPQIDAMFRSTSSTEHRVGSQPVASTSAPTSISSNVAAAATAKPPPLTPETSPLALVSSTANFASILRDYSAVVANFTNTPGCAPCRAIKPAYESIAGNAAGTYGPKGVRFVEIELGIGEGQDLARQYGVTATPTFIFYRSGKKVDEMRGATKRELEGRVEKFLEDCFPRHPHRKLYLPAVEALSITPVTSAGVPAYPALLGKLEGFTSSRAAMIRSEVVPFLGGKATLSVDALRDLIQRWTTLTTDLISTLPPEQLFPIIDLWRIGLLNARLAAILALATFEPINPILAVAATTLSKSSTSTPKPFLLTTLRLLTNLLTNLPLANIHLADPSNVLSVTVESLLHPDTPVRSAAATVAVNLASHRARVARETARQREDVESPEWEVDLVSALVEGLGRESDEDVAHRLLVALGLVLYLSSGYEESLKPLLEVLDARSVIEKRSKGWKKEVRKLADEIASKLC